MKRSPGGGSSSAQRPVWAGAPFASAWTGFAKTGVPNSDMTPEWTPYDLDKRATMVFDINTRVENDYRREFRLLWDELGGGGLLGQ